MLPPNHGQPVSPNGDLYADSNLDHDDERYEAFIKICRSRSIGESYALAIRSAVGLNFCTSGWLQKIKSAIASGPTHG